MPMCSPYHLDMYECIAACVCMRASHGQSFDKFHTETDTKVANQPNGCPTAFVAATFEMAIVDSFVDWHCKSGRCLLARLPIVLLFFFLSFYFLFQFICICRRWQQRKQNEQSNWIVYIFAWIIFMQINSNKFCPPFSEFAQPQSYSLPAGCDFIWSFLQC